MATYYDRLGVGPAATQDELRAAYRRLARRHHPDAHGGHPSVEMTALNEAWYVLRDPGRRALYDASLRGTPAPSPAPRPSAAEDEPDVEPTAHVGIPLGWIAVLVALAAIFVFTAYAASSRSGGGHGVDGLLHAGECVVVDREGYAVEASCTGPHDGVVAGLPPFDAPCPSGSSSYRDRNGMSQVCVMPG